MMDSNNTDNIDVRRMLERAHAATRELLRLSDSEVCGTLNVVADALEANCEGILAANARDLSRMDPADSKYDRLKLTASRLADIAADMRHVASLPSPRVELENRTLPNGLHLSKVAVPFGVVGVIFEARPNVCADVFSLCFRSGNVCVLKGGHDADDTNRAIVAVIASTLSARGISPDVVTLLPSSREAAEVMMHARGLVDLIIPRGGASLIRNVRDNATVPVIETGAGVCHCYIDRAANIEYARRIVDNAKTRRVSVCNALDCVVVHGERLADLPEIMAPLAAKSVVVHADAPSYAALSGSYPAELLVEAEPDDFGHEFLSYQLAVKTVSDEGEAIEHIARYGSGHSESIVTDDESAAQRFMVEVDAACVYHNAPTSFTDGAQFGLGAEIGISTQKLHARGPMALRELMTYKWLVRGAAQTRP
jgi:glutamate-5-semialdehyde dehydrogenase